MTYVLLIAIFGSGSAVSSAEYRTEEACITAAKAMKEQVEEPGRGRLMIWTCKPKG